MGADERERLRHHAHVDDETLAVHDDLLDLVIATFLTGIQAVSAVETFSAIATSEASTGMTADND